MFKKELKVMWLFSSGVSLIALAANASVQEWWWSVTMLVLTAYNLVMLHLSQQD